MSDEKFWGILLLLALVAVLAAITSCDMRANKLSLDMASKGYCWEQGPYTPAPQWRPCTPAILRTTAEKESR